MTSARGVNAGLHPGEGDPMTRSSDSCGEGRPAPRALPRRVQREREGPGWSIPSGAVFVGRGTKWANPITQDIVRQAWDYSLNPAPTTAELRHEAIRAFRDGLAGLQADAAIAYPSTVEIRAELRGRDLVCWCPLGQECPTCGQSFDQPCHADVLLEVANA